MKGMLYAVGVGPGDPELLTLKAKKVLERAGVICFPRGREGGGSLALGIVEQVMDLGEKEVMEVHFPMKKGSQREALLPAAARVRDILARGTDVAFITLGDPTLYSTFFHLHDALKELDTEVSFEVVPGVSSITAAGARAGVSLALSGERLAVLPATYAGDLDRVLRDFDTVVLMKVHRVLDDVKKILSARGLLEGAVCVSRAGMKGELVKPLAETSPEEIDYFSTVIVRGRRDG
ncbi:MAG: precorrin-2 C(20)-methyltransferase [Nitrospirota bacterium]